MVNVKLKKDESRKDYLVRVAIEVLNENAYRIESVIYDEAECDAFALAEDLSIEFFEVEAEEVINQGFSCAKEESDGARCASQCGRCRAKNAE